MADGLPGRIFPHSTSTSVSNVTSGRRYGDVLANIRMKHKKIFDATVHSFERSEEKLEAHKHMLRILVEYLPDDKTPGISLCPIDGDPTNALACIEGPLFSPYSGGIFWLHIWYPPDYPFMSPKVRFLTPIYHPGIDAYGDFYLEELLTGEKEGIGWVCTRSTNSILLLLFWILDKPNPKHFREVDIHNECNLNYDEFLQNAKLHTAKYAMSEEPDTTKLVKNWLTNFGKNPKIDQDSKPRIDKNSRLADVLAVANPDDIYEACLAALFQWREEVWERCQQYMDLPDEIIMPTSAINTMAENLIRMKTNKVALEELPMNEWEHRLLFFEDHSDTSIWQVLDKVWKKCLNEVVENAEYERMRESIEKRVMRSNVSGSGN